jgi:hypothetical protein
MTLAREPLNFGQGQNDKAYQAYLAALRNLPYAVTADTYADWQFHQTALGKKYVAGQVENRAALDRARGKEKERLDAIDQANRKRTSVFGFIANAAKAAGRAAGSAVSAVNSVTGAIGSAIQKVPLAGPLYHAAFDLYVQGPFQIAQGLASGKRIDQVALGRIQSTMADWHEAAPYAQAVISLVPAAGPAVAAGLGTAVALANGQSISDSLIAGARGAIPGGPLAQAGFDMGVAAMKGERIDQAALNVATSAAGLSPAASQALRQGLTAARDLADGKKVSQVALDQAEQAAKQYLPATAQKALTVGIALGQGKRLQDIAAQQLASPGVVDKLAAQGAATVGSTPALAAISSTLEPAQKQAFNLGVQISQYSAGQAAIESARNRLDAAGKKAFDMALAAHVGRVTTRPMKGADGRIAGAWLARGMRTMPVKHRVAIIHQVASRPEIRAGLVQSADEISHEKAGGFVGKFFSWIASLFGARS